MDSLLSNLMRLRLGVLGLVLVNGFFVAAELALVRIRDTQIETLVLKGHRRARIVWRALIKNLDLQPSARSQSGITLASLGLGVLVEPVFEALLLAPAFNGLGRDFAGGGAAHTVAIMTGFIVNCFLLVVVGELGPKAVAIRKTLPVALWTAEPLSWFATVATPFVWVLNHSAQWLLRQAGIRTASEAERSHSDEELRLLISVSQARAGASGFGREIVLNALDFRGRIVREVMRPRQEIIALDTDASIGECLELAEKTRYSRFPLCEGGNLDKTRGVIHIKDLFALRDKARTGCRTWAPALRKC